MDSEFSLRTATVDVLENLVASLADFVPRALTAVLVILIGILIAKLAEKAVRTIFDKLRIDSFLERIGISQVLQKLGLQGSPGKVLSRTIYFLLVVLFVQSVTRAVGMFTIADAIGSFFSYLPSLVAAFLVLLLGMIVAQFMGKAVTRSAAESGVEFAPLLGRIVSALILFVVIIMSISQLQIETKIVNMVVLVLLSGISLALALTFGLGSREVTRNIVAGFYARQLFRIGEEVAIGGERGVLASITATKTLIERDGQTLAIPNRMFLDEIVRQ